MNMKEHILAALREQFERWEELLAGLSEVQILAPRFELGWSIKDGIAHLWAWQQVSLARMKAAAADREPNLPGWVADLPADWEDNADATNTRIYAANAKKPWSQVYDDWRQGFLQLLDAAEPISEKDLLDADGPLWMSGYSPASVLLGTYDHHREHLDWVMASLRAPGK